MANKVFRRYRSSLITIGFIIAILVLMTNIADNRESTNEYQLRRAEISGISNNHVINLERPYWAIQDSVRNLKEWATSRLKDVELGVGNKFVAVREINECDSCYSLFRDKYKNDYRTKYFIELSGYTLERDAAFLIQNDKYYVEYIIWDSVYQNGSRSGHPETKEVAVRYTTNGLNGSPAGAVLLPVSYSKYRTFKTLTWIVSIIGILFCLIAILIMPVRVLIGIANGKPFTEQNIGRLRFIGWSLIVIAVLPSLTSIFAEWLLRKTIPKEIYFPFWLSVSDSRPYLVAGLVVLLVATAFKAGFKLKAEQELTV